MFSVSSPPQWESGQSRLSNMNLLQPLGRPGRFCISSKESGAPKVELFRGREFEIKLKFHQGATKREVPIQSCHVRKFQPGGTGLVTCAPFIAPLPNAILDFRGPQCRHSLSKDSRVAIVERNKSITQNPIRTPFSSPLPGLAFS